MEHIKHLSDKMPHRHLGEPDEIKAAQYIAEMFNRSGVESKLLETRVMGWEVEKGPILEILRPSSTTIECAPFIYSASTPPAGVLGELKRVGTETVIGSFRWNKYAIVDPVGGDTLAFVVGRDIGPAISQPVANPSVNWPSCIIGSRDAEMMENWTRTGERVTARYTCETRFKPGMRAYNVQGTLMGKTEPDKIIVVSAHHDSQGALGFPDPIDSPGASDNASAVAVLIELAKRLAQKKTCKTIHFLSYCGEEWGLVGSRDYVEYLEERGELENVVACVNLEEISKGIVLCCTDKEHETSPRIGMKAIVQSVYEEMGLPSRIGTTWEVPPVGPDSDHWPFYMKGKPVAYLHPQLYMEYHRSTDRFPDVIDQDTWRLSFDLTARIVERIDSMAI